MLVRILIQTTFSAYYLLSFMVTLQLLSSLFSSVCLATFGIQTGSERPSHDYQRGGVGGARKQRQRSSRQINLRRDLRSRTLLSTCVYARAHLQASHVRAQLYRSELSSIAMVVSEGNVRLNDQRRRMDQLLLISP